jgi:calcium permeable stress-gated cation channel
MEDISIDEIPGLENYLLERYLHTMLRIFILLALVLLPILVPLNVVDSKNESGGVMGLDRLSFANVGLSHTNRYWAHLVLAIFAVIFVCLILRYELQYYSQLQQTMDHAQWGSSTVLLTSSSKEPLSVATIQKHLDAFHRGVRAIRMNRDHRSLLAKIHKRDKLIAKLEAAETSLIRKAIGKRDIHV